MLLYWSGFVALVVLCVLGNVWKVCLIMCSYVNQTEIFVKTVCSAESGLDFGDGTVDLTFVNVFTYQLGARDRKRKLKKSLCGHIEIIFYIQNV